MPLQSRTIAVPPVGFTFLSNHAHVLLLIARENHLRMRELAIEVGITERAVQRIVDDLTSNGYLLVKKEGRRNRYEVVPNQLLRHPVEGHRTIGDLIQFVHPSRAGFRVGEVEMSG